LEANTRAGKTRRPAPLGAPKRRRCRKVFSHIERGISLARSAEHGSRIDDELSKRIAVLPIDYLREIEHANFPLDETDPGKVHCVELLCAVSYLDATVTRGPSQWRARIRRITWMGRVALQAGAG
jgi:hypothetical protein